MYVRFLFICIVATAGAGRLAGLFSSLLRTNRHNRFDFKTFESVYKFQPQCDHEDLDGDLLNKINEFKTLEKTPVVIEEDDMTVLMTDCNNDENCFQRQSVVLDKCRVKIQMIQCVNGLIVRHMIDRIRDVTNKEVPPYPGLIELMLKYRIVLANMLSVIYSFRLMVYDWQMIVYINVLNVIDDRDHITKNIHIIKYIQHITTALENVDLHTDFCRKHGYLDIDNIDGQIINVDEIMNELYQNDKLRCGYGAADMMTVQNFRLESLHNRCYDILGATKSYRFNWNRTMTRCDEAMLFINNLGNKYQWSMQPYATSWPAYDVVMSMVYSKVIYHTWLQLSVYQSNMTSRHRIGDDRQRALRKYLNLLVEPLKEAIRIFDIIDNAIWPVYRLLRSNDEIIDSEQFEGLLQLVRGVLEKTLKFMKADDVSRKLTNKFIDFEILDETDLDNNKANIQELNAYIKKMKKSLMPTDIIFFMRFFIKSFNNKSFWVDNEWKDYY